MGRIVTLCALILASAVPSASAAHKTKKLTDANITAFIEEMSSMSSGHSLSHSSEQIKDFLNAHLHPNARFKSIMQYNVPGQPPQQSALALDKAKFMENIQAGAQAMEDYESNVEITQINISKDGRKATLNTQSQESGMMSVDDQSGSGVEKASVVGASLCVQIVMLSKQDIIQLYNANCNTSISFQQ